MCLGTVRINNTLRVTRLSILAAAILVGFGSLASVRAQIGLPDAAALPEVKGAWVVDLFYHSNVINGFAAANPNNTRILVQSDGTVFRRMIIQYREFANDSGWCQDRFTAEEMRNMRAAVGKFRPDIWKDVYGPLPTSLAPFGTVSVIVRDANGKAVDNTIKLFRFDTVPPDLMYLVDQTWAAGALAFSNCQNSR
jgi:hypothetical protein